MKAKLLRVLLLVTVIYTMNSCSSDSSDEEVVATVSKEKIMDYTYSPIEIEAMDLINDYRVSIGLNKLEQITHISYKSEQHDNYMIENNVVNHDDFVARSENLIKVLGAKKVSENIAYNYNTSKAALEAWLNSPGHKANIEGDFTHFGIAIKTNPSNGKKYYTNIFIKK